MNPDTLNVAFRAVMDVRGAYLDLLHWAVHEYRERHGVTDPIREIDWSGVYWRKGR